ncbi:MAG TPA: alpha-amylase family protein [Kofleriaceae bacterium]
MIAGLALAACSHHVAMPDAAVVDEPGQATSANQRTAFVQLFEWTWTDIARECESYLGPKGFAAVQISPPNEHAWIATGDGAPFPWWMRYQPVSYSLDRSRSGTRAEFIDMVARCRTVGVAIYADVVINHMTGGAGQTSSSGAHPWSEEHYPGVPYEVKDFHAPCDVDDYHDAHNVQTCRLVGLQDLDTGASYVRGKIADYLVDLATIGVEGFRVDAAKHISASDLLAITDAVGARLPAPPLWFLEVIGAAGEAVQPSQYFGISGGAVTITEFGYGAQLAAAFGGGTLAGLKALGVGSGLMPSHKAVPFTDNHDKQRGHAGGGSYLTYHDGARYDLANVFLLAWPYGYPVLMSSYAFNTQTTFDTSYGPPADPTTGATRGPWAGVADGGAPACGATAVGGWVCEHRYRAIGNMVGFRNATGAAWDVTGWWDNGKDQIAFGRGSLGFVVINGEAQALTRTFQTGLAAGTYCDVIAGDFANGACAGPTITVDAAGNAAITAGAMTAVAIHAGAKVEP